jgi:hypothetical protein
VFSAYFLLICPIFTFLLKFFFHIIINIGTFGRSIPANSASSVHNAALAAGLRGFVAIFFAFLTLLALFLALFALFLRFFDVFSAILAVFCRFFAVSDINWVGFLVLNVV